MTKPARQRAEQQRQRGWIGEQAARNTQRQQHRQFRTVLDHDVQSMGVDLAESVAMPDHRLAVLMAAQMVVRMVVIVIPRAASAIARLAGFAHGERHKIALRPQHP
ncbi:hypothetical protein QA640_44910 (plasmid) [Bradyrhizobium sp. CB82]|uniref:hypothetical protein n=1 Tax=Bradyrhizobium sp. CB82 TaxID=3039159 RepID=UPI0024B04797|nr:hypothetical protein [Bradyrhizobium sp. CB82]WFU45935.1 hypothetical protein QA640_44910 [Bradyrhizobium sp. CB82]